MTKPGCNPQLPALQTTKRKTNSKINTKPNKTGSIKSVKVRASISSRSLNWQNINIVPNSLTDNHKKKNQPTSPIKQQKTQTKKTPKNQNHQPTKNHPYFCSSKFFHDPKECLTNSSLPFKQDYSISPGRWMYILCILPQHLLVFSTYWF